MQEYQLNRRDLVLISTGLAVVCCALVADNSVNGHVQDSSDAIHAAVQRLASIPESIGPWTSVDHEISDREQEVAGIVGYIRRTYTNHKTGYEVQLTVLCGPSGPIAVHPPTACFQGIGYSVVSGPTLTRLKAADDVETWEFNKSSFRQDDASIPDLVRVFWGWSTDGHWKAPSTPRLEFRGKPFLFKIYVTDHSLEETTQAALPQIEAFLHDALPVLASSLASEITASDMAIVAAGVD